MDFTAIQDLAANIRKFIMRKVKITVIRKEFYPDFADKFLSDGKDAGGLLPMGVD